MPQSDAVVEVLAGEAGGFRPGDLAVRKGRAVDTAVPDELRGVASGPGSVPYEAWLTVLGHVGFTAYTGMLHIGRVQPGETVFVSGRPVASAVPPRSRPGCAAPG